MSTQTQTLPEWKSPDILRISPLGLGNSMCLCMQPFPTASVEQKLLMATLVWPDTVAAAWDSQSVPQHTTDIYRSTHCHSCAECSTEAEKMIKLTKGCCGTSAIRPPISLLFWWEAVMINTRKGQRNRIQGKSAKACTWRKYRGMIFFT